MATATYGSELVAVIIATEKIIDHRLTLWYLGVQVTQKTYLFGDNNSVVECASIPQSKLHKLHTALSFHRVKEAIAGKVQGFYHINGEISDAKKC